jgi:hypothetical protein
MRKSPAARLARCPIAFERFRRVMATIAAAIDFLVTVIKAAVIAGAL